MIPGSASSSNMLTTASDLTSLNTSLTAAIALKENKLSNGETIKRINGNDVLGSGNLSVGTITGVTVTTTSPILKESTSGNITSGSFDVNIRHAPAPTVVSGDEGAYTYGSTGTQTPAVGTTFNVPYIVTDGTGHVSSRSGISTVTVPATPGDDGYGLTLSDNNKLRITRNIKLSLGNAT